MIEFAWLLIGLITASLLLTLGETLLWCYIWMGESWQAAPSQGAWNRAIVFITGISDYSAATLTPVQREFLQKLDRQFASDIMLAEPFPYDNLTPPKFARFDIWRYLGYQEPPLWVISLHNFWQTLLAVCWEKHYGNAVARCLINQLGLPKSPDRILVFICGSAGASLVLAAAPMLKERLQARLFIISYGGVFGASPGFHLVDGFYHLIGTKDNWTKLGEMVFPGRRLPWGALSRAKQENRFSIHYTGEHTHMGYLSDRVSDLLPGPDTPTYQKLTLDTITSLPVWQENGFKI